MSDRGHELFIEYVLGLLADSQKQRDAFDTKIHRVVASVTATDLRLRDVQQEVGQLHDVLAKYRLAEKERDGKQRRVEKSVR